MNAQSVKTPTTKRLRRDAARAEAFRRQREAHAQGFDRSEDQHYRSLLMNLQKAYFLYGSNGEPRYPVTLFQYWAKYDRAELRKILNVVKYYRNKERTRTHLANSLTHLFDRSNPHFGHTFHDRFPEFPARFDMTAVH